MHSIRGFIENRNAQIAKRREAELQTAVLKRDVFGPDYTSKGRKRDLKALRSNRAPVMKDPNGNPYPPLQASDTVMQGNSKASKKRRKSLPDYNATRPLGQ